MATTNKFPTIPVKSQSVNDLLPQSLQNSDFELIQTAAAGDIQAFEQIYWQYHQKVYRICLRMTKNVAEAEDVTQKVFLKLFRKIGNFRGESAFSTWLHRLTVNEVLMHFRHIKSRKEQPTEAGKLPEEFPAQKNSSGSNQIVNRVLLKEAIAKLPDSYRKVLILHDVQGFNHEEIGQILGCAVGTTKSHLFWARKKLRGFLRNDAETLNQ
jgi:RNA polymerase sigma-70 factor (ECF subfamily)